MIKIIKEEEELKDRDMLELDNNYQIVRQGNEYLVLKGYSQLDGMYFDTLEDAKKAVEGHNRKSKEEIPEHVAGKWKLRKELDPDNSRDCRTAERNGFYLNDYSSVYEYVDKDGFLHYSKSGNLESK